MTPTPDNTRTLFSVIRTTHMIANLTQRLPGHVLWAPQMQRFRSCQGWHGRRWDPISQASWVFVLCRPFIADALHTSENTMLPKRELSLQRLACQLLRKSQNLQAARQWRLFCLASMGFPPAGCSPHSSVSSSRGSATDISALNATDFWP